MMKDGATQTSGLIQYVDSLVESLRTDLPGALERGDTDAVHDARVATRRLKAVLTLLESQVSEGLNERFDTALKKTRRTMGPLRDLDVMNSHLCEMSKLDPETIRYLVELLQLEREDALLKLNQTNTSKLLAKLGNWWGLRAQIREDAIQFLLRDSLRLQLEYFSQQADRFRTGIAKTESAEAGFGLDPHQLRITGKTLRYTLEMARYAGYDIPPRVLSSFKKLQDMLGLWHDHIVLTNKIMQLCLDRDMGYHNGHRLRRLLRLAQFTARRAEKHFAQFLAVWGQHGAGIHDAIKAAIESHTRQAAPAGTAASAPPEFVPSAAPAPFVQNSSEPRQSV